MIGSMKELLLVCAVVVIFVFGYYIMKKLDAFLINNQSCIKAENTEKSLLIAFDNLMIIDSLMPLFERFSKENPDCQLHFLFGSTEDIYNKLNKNSINIGFIKYTYSKDEDIYNNFIISVKPSYIFCENIGYDIEPLNFSDDQTIVIWKKHSNNSFTNSFSDFLLSNQAEYLK